MTTAEYAASSARNAVQGALAPRESATLLSALNTIGEANGSLTETAEWAERLAEQLVGPVPRAQPSEKMIGDAGSLVGALSERADSLRAPTIRIRDALSRIERSIGH